MDSRSVLEQVRSGKLSVAEAERYFNRKAYENLNYARLDTSREQRTGFAEVVYCSGKPDAYLADIYKRLLAEQGEVFGTRATPEQYELVRELLAPHLNTLYVTSKDIDASVNRLSSTISDAINLALKE